MLMIAGAIIALILVGGAGLGSLAILRADLKLMNENTLPSVDLVDRAEVDLLNTRLGVTIMPAAPGFYHEPKSIEDLVDFMVARILDHLGVEHELTSRWGYANH
jgi:hypothetical protein